jgi:hypothetical protein
MNQLTTNDITAENESKNDIGDFFDLGALPFGEELESVGVAAGAGLAGVLAWEAGIEHIPLPPSAPAGLFPILEMVVGAIAGPLVAMHMPRAGMGLGVALVTSGASRFLRSTSFGANLYPAAAMQTMTAPAVAPTSGFGAPSTLLLGDTAVDIEEVNPNLGDSAVAIEDTTDELNGLSGILG